MADQPADMSHFTLNDLAPYAEGLFQSEILQDWAQTRDRKYGYNPVTHVDQQEANTILGTHPSKSKIDTYEPLMMLAHYAGYKALPDDYKFPYAALSSLLEGNIVRFNTTRGDKYSVPALGLGGLITYFLAKDYNEKHKGSRIEPFAATSEKGTPVQGVSLKW